MYFFTNRRLVLDTSTDQISICISNIESCNVNFPLSNVNLQEFEYCYFRLITFDIFRSYYLVINHISIFTYLKAFENSAKVAGGAHFKSFITSLLRIGRDRYLIWMLQIFFCNELGQLVRRTIVGELKFVSLRICFNGSNLRPGYIVMSNIVIGIKVSTSYFNYCPGSRVSASVNSELLSCLREF